MEMKHDHSQMDHSMHMGHNHGDIANSKQMDHSMHMDHEHGGMDHSMHMKFQTKILAIAYPSYPNHSFFTNDGNGISISSNVSWF